MKHRSLCRGGFVVLMMALCAPAWGRDETRISEHLTVPEGQEVDNAISLGGDVVVYGNVLKDAVSVGGDLVVKPSGRVGRNGLAFGGRVIVDAGGEIGGQQLEIQNIPGLSSLGQLGVLTTRLPEIQHSAISTLLFLREIYWLNATVVALALGLLVQAAVFGRVEAVSRTIERRHWKAACIGMAGFLGVLLLIGMVAISVIWIPLIPVLVILVTVALLLGYVAVGFAAGRHLPVPFVANAPFFATACGMLLLTLACALPWVGAYVFAAANLLGFGAVLMSRFGADGNS